MASKACQVDGVGKGTDTIRFRFLFLFLVGLLRSQLFSDVAEGLLLALFGQHGKKCPQKLLRLRMHLQMVMASEKIVQRTSVHIVASKVDLACRNPVTEHFYDIDQRHLHRCQSMYGHGVVCPVLKMMFVSAFVVHPGVGASIFATFLLGRTVGSAVESGSWKELGRAVFGKVMHEATPRDTCLDAVEENDVSMSCDGSKVSYDVHAHNSTDYSDLDKLLEEQVNRSSEFAANTLLDDVQVL